MDAACVHTHSRRVTVRRALLRLALLLVLAVVRPGVLLNGLRSPLAWLLVGGLVLLAAAVRVALRRTGASPRWSGAAGSAVVVVGIVALLVPSFLQRTLVEVLPLATGVGPVTAGPSEPAGPSTSSAGAAPAAAPAASTSEPVPEPVPAAQRSGPLEGIGHSARGTVRLRVVGGATHVVFEDVDIEGTVDPYVHLVPDGRRTPSEGVRLGALKAERGSFSYRLPDSVDGSRTWSVLVWCDPYDTPVAAADPR